MGKTDININVGLNGDLGVPILSPNETSCSTCSIKDMSPAERKIYDDFVENPISQILFGFIPCLKGSTEYAFPCQNNVATNGLTSGYYESEKDIAPKPPSGNKCSHGGGFDESVTIAATGGISKDADNMFFAPHYKLHQKAAKLAVEATLQYFEDFRLSIKDEKKFGQLIGIQKTPSIGIAIVLDTTESMKTQWNDVITQVLDDIDEVTKKNPSKTINYFLMPFNDPDFGFPSEDKGVFATNDLTQFSQKLSSLKPKGGGDIPEMCLPAILSTLKKVGTGVSINVYTDSISKKPELLQQIGAIAVGKNVKVSFTMFGENLPNSINHKKSLSSVLGLRHSHEIFQDYQKINVDEEDSNSNETEAYSTLQDYVNLATLTEGFYEKYRKIYGAKQRFSATNNISRNDWEIIDSVYINDITAFSYSFIVDDTMNYIEIEMDLLFGGETIKNLNVNISSPTTLLPLNENFTTDMVRKFVYNNPTPGNWTMNINNIDVTQYILLKVSSPSYLDVHIRLIPSLNSSTQHLRAPIIGEGKYDIFVECASCKTMESLIVTPCGNETRYHQSAPVYVTSFNWWYIENVIFPAAGGLICFEINGTTLRGNRFTRLIDKKISLISVGIKGSVSKPEIFNHQNASLSFYITNYGASDSFNLTIITNKNINLSFNQKIYTINSKATINDTIEISITDPYVFSINLELTVTAQSTPSMTAQQNYFISILDSDDDIDAPVCNILTDGNSTCPFDSCVDQKYDAEVEFYDSGTGVFRINAEEGEWNIQKFDKGTTAKLNASGKLDCCTEISRFFVFDKNGLIGRCLFKNNVKGKPSTTSTTITPTTTTSNSPVSNILLIFLPIFTSNEPDKLTEDTEMLKCDAKAHSDGKLRADLEKISGDIQTVPSVPLITADSQLTEEDIFRMKRHGPKNNGASKMQSVASVVDSTSNFCDHVPDDNGSMNIEEPLDITEKDVIDQLYADEIPVQSERDIHLSICGRYGFNRNRMPVPQFPPGIVTELTFPFAPKNIPESFSPEEYNRMFSQSKIFLVGTAHFSKSSQDDVRRTIRMTQPDVVMIELCASRRSILSMDDQTFLKKAKNIDRKSVINLIRESGFAQGILRAVLLSTSADTTRQLGMAPGGEFRAAYKESLKVPCCRLTLGDRPVQVTFQRAVGAMGIFQKICLLYQLIFSNDDTITPEDVERCKQKDVIEEIIREMAEEFPELTKIFINERDEYMVHFLQTLLESTTEEKIMAARDCGAEYQPVNIVAVVGIGHTPGIAENWCRKVNIAELLCIPEPSFASKAFKFTVKAAVAGAAVYGIYRLGVFTYAKIRPT